jgi:glycosyltransferase involved in cell wall biosynthesis
MRVLIANALYPPLTTGSSHFTADLALELSTRGHDVHVLTTFPPGESPDDRSSPVGITRVPARWVRPGPIAFNYEIPLLRGRPRARIEALLDEFRPDVVSCHGQIFDLSWRVARAARRRGVPVTVTVHSAIRHTNPVGDLVLRAAERMTVRPALSSPETTWIAVDKRTFDHARQTYKPAPGHLHFISVVLRADEFRDGDGDQARARFDLGAGPIILSLGHVVPVRDRVALVRALPHIVERYPDTKVVIVGELYTSSYQRVAEDLGVAGSIIATGRVPHADIPDLLAAAAVEIHDLQGIGLGITTLEAMAAGVPIVAFVPDDNYPGLSMTAWPDLSLVDDVEPTSIAAAVLSLLDDPDRRAAVTAEQHRFIAALFSPEAVAAGYEELFEAVVSH